MGRYVAALAELQKVLENRSTVLGNDHLDMLATRAQYAKVFLLTCQAVAALPQRAEALFDCRRVLGSEHPTIATIRLRLANAYREVGQIDRTIPLLEENLVDTRVEGTLALRNNLAMT